MVDYDGRRLLFDTGASGSVLLENLQQLGIDPATIEAVILSHQHDDHIGGLPALLATGVHPTVYAPALFSASESQVSSIIAELRQLGVQRVMPSHCTGDKAIALFRSEYGEDFVEGGVGRVVTISGQ